VLTVEQDEQPEEENISDQPEEESEVKSADSNLDFEDLDSNETNNDVEEEEPRYSPSLFVKIVINKVSAGRQLWRLLKRRRLLFKKLVKNRNPKQQPQQATLLMQHRNHKLVLPGISPSSSLACQ